ncbi:MAG: right-handed parallel beta-helix repeat-containing protein [Phycisphaerae bacterium]|nr:right-handed parallel beta-helix repeat-containing protein [Phycisphaerae bacterium]
MTFLIFLMSICTMFGGIALGGDVEDPNDPNEPQPIVLEVPTEDYPTIQSAIDAIDTEDPNISSATIIVHPGLYTGKGNRDLDFYGKNIRLTSDDPNSPEIVAMTIIDCQGSMADPHRAFYFHSEETKATIVDGFTITGGYMTGNGGAIYCNIGSPTIKNCVLKNNVAWGPDKAGGAIGCYNSSPTIMNCQITDNRAAAYGGGISCRNNSSPIIRDCTIINNTANISGGGVYCWVNSSPQIERCLITYNTTLMYGGGLYFFECAQYNPNIPEDDPDYDPNDPDNDPNFVPIPDIVIQQCTIANNSVDGGTGGAIFCSDSIATLSNSIVWGNIAPNLIGSTIALSDNELNKTTLTVSYSDVEGDQDGQYVIGANAVLEWLDGNIALDPNFADAQNGDFHLMSSAGRWIGQNDEGLDVFFLDDGGNFDESDDINSPCIDAGDPGVPVGDEHYYNGDVINQGFYGGTSQASLSYSTPTGKGFCTKKIPGDVNGDCYVDLKDLAMMAQSWLECNLLPRYNCWQ